AVDRRLERADDIGVRGLVEPHVAVADLRETQRARRPGGEPRWLAEAVRLEDPAFDQEERARPSPCHALEKPAPIDAVIVFVVEHCSLLSRPTVARAPESNNGLRVERRSPCKLRCV